MLSAATATSPSSTSPASLRLDDGVDEFRALVRRLFEQGRARMVLNMAGCSHDQLEKVEKIGAPASRGGARS